MKPSQVLHVHMYVCLKENTISSNHIQQPYTYIIIYHKHYPTRDLREGIQQPYTYIIIYHKHYPTRDLREGKIC